MRGKRAVAVVSLVVGIAVGLLAGPILNMGGAAAAASSYRYICIRPGSIPTGIHMVNLTGETAKLKIDDGTTIDPIESTIPPDGYGFHGISPGQGRTGPIRIRSNRKLLMEGTVEVNVQPHNDTPHWSIKCE